MNHERLGAYSGLVIVTLALLLWSVGCGGGGGESVSPAGGFQGPIASGSPTSTPTASSSPLQGSTPPAPPELAVPTGASAAREFVSGRVLVRTREPVSSRSTGSAPRELTEAAASRGLHLKRKRRFKHLRTEELQIESGQSVEEVVARLSQLPEVEFAEPDYILTAAEITPDDSRFGDLWAHKNTGQAGGLEGADIASTLAWDITTGDPNVVISVIDSGVDYNHPDLAANMWKNSAEANGVPNFDDDGNGYVDDIYGINAINGSGDPMDDNGHGTHVAGTAAAVGNNTAGVVGVAYGSKIMALKFLNDTGTGATSDAIECLEYAIENGAKVSNASWGGPVFNLSLRNALIAARNQNHLVVAAAGNAGSNVDSRTRHYPSGFDLDNIISVGASDRTEAVSSFSNFGAVSVDLFAPGSSIVSTFPDNNYATFSGTSMAAPQVTGTAALVISQMGGSPAYSAVKDRILNNVERFPAYAGRCLTGGRLNAHYAVGPEANPSPGPEPTGTPAGPSNPSPISESIALRRGWNLISFPLDRIESLSIPPGVQNVVWLWNASGQSYQSIAATPDSLNSGQGTARGFWLFSEGTAVLNFTGFPAQAKTVTLERGWNLVGLPRESTITTSKLTVTNLSNQQESLLSKVTCDDIPASLPCMLFQYMFFWQNDYLSLNAASSTSLANERGYWIHAWSRCELNYFPISIEH